MDDRSRHPAGKGATHKAATGGGGRRRNVPIGRLAIRGEEEEKMDSCVRGNDGGVRGIREGEVGRINAALSGRSGGKTVTRHGFSLAALGVARGTRPAC
ncbi:MAG: hypothetical protein D8M59_01550 [Planctomycetes bacterium]|nr:hypothetical protein [Planctomycetota bacterium]